MECKRCGDCCKGDTLFKGEDKETIEYAKALAALMGKDMMKLQCPHLDFRIGLAICKIYKDRPWFCKEHYCSKC